MKIINESVIFSGADAPSRQRAAFFPSLARLSDDCILCAFQVASEKSGPDETIRIAQSSDEGQSWRLTDFEPNPVLNGVAGGYRLAHIVETAPGELFMVANWLDRSDPSAPISHPETAGVLDMRLVGFRSRDGGASWSEAQDLTKYSSVDQPEVSGPIIELQEPGHFLIPMENQKRYHDPNPIHEKAFCLISRDGCETWDEEVTICDRFPHYKHWCNRVAVLPAGKLLCASWTFDETTQQDLPIHLLSGSPDGTRWSEPLSSGVQGQLSTPFPLGGSTLLLGYVHRHQPASIRLVKSEDGGESWDLENELVVYSAAANATSDGYGGNIAAYYQFLAKYTFGWNPLLRLKNGNVMMAYFAGDEISTSIYRAEIAV